MNKTWAWVRNIGLLLALPLAVIQIFQWLRSPSPDLHAAVTYDELILPDTFQRGVDLIHNFPYAKTLQSYDADATPSVPQESGHSEFTESLRELYLRDKLHENPVFNDLKNIEYLSGVWTARVQNNGTKTAHSVSLTLPNTVRVRIERPGRAVIETPSDKRISLDDVEAKEEIKITAWAEYAHRPVLLYGVTEITLVHESGLGSVDYQDPLGSPWPWLALQCHVYRPLVWGLLLPIVGCGVVFVLDRVQRRRAK